MFDRENFDFIPFKIFKIRPSKPSSFTLEQLAYGYILIQFLNFSPF